MVTPSLRSVGERFNMIFARGVMLYELHWRLPTVNRETVVPIGHCVKKISIYVGVFVGQSAAVADI